MAIVFRPAQETDLLLAQEMIVASINDLTTRHGFGPIASVRPPLFQQQVLADDPSSLWVAEDAGRIVGAAFSWLCGDLWFLAELFVDPALQGEGVGGELLARVFAQADRAQAKTRALITFAFNAAAQTLYAREGMYPRLPLHMMMGQREAVAARLPTTDLRATAIEDIGAARETLAQLDAGALALDGGTRHRMLSEDPSMTGYLLHRAGECVGYAWIAGSGHIGPLAAATREDMHDVLAAALRIATQGESKRVSAFISGNNEAALALATHCGLRIALPMVLAANGDFGDWRRYLPRNPLFM